MNDIVSSGLHFDRWFIVFRKIESKDCTFPVRSPMPCARRYDGNVDAGEADGLISPLERSVGISTAVLIVY